MSSLENEEDLGKWRERRRAFYVGRVNRAGVSD